MELKIKKLQDDAVIPTRAHDTDAGMDLYAAMGYIVRPGERVQVRVGVSMAIPAGYVGLVWDKSGLSHKNGLKVLGGVIDASYRGEVMVGIVNLGTGPYKFERGQKVAQMLIQKIETPEILIVDELDDTQRGVGGFGSTGK